MSLMTLETIYKYRIYCSTDSKYETIWSTTAPTTCPVNTGHTITSLLTSIVEIRDPTSVTIQEESTPTNGKYQTTTHTFDAVDASGSVTESTFSFSHNISVLSAYIISSSDQEGDVLNVHIAANTTVGALTVNASAGTNTLNVSSTVKDYSIPRMKCRLVDGSGNINEMGWIMSIDTDNNIVTTEHPTDRTFSATSPTYFQITPVFADNFEFGPSWKYDFGASKIGGAHVPANTVVKFLYTNNGTSSKRIRVNFEYLY